MVKRFRSRNLFNFSGQGGIVNVHLDTVDFIQCGPDIQKAKRLFPARGMIKIKDRRRDQENF